MELILSNFFILMLILVFLTVCIFYIGHQLAIYADLLSVEMRISGAFVGFVLIAMITSIPEMVSTFVSVSKGSYGLAVGGVFGSNAVNIAILSGLLLIFHKQKIKIENSSIFSFLSSLILLAFVGLVMEAFFVSQISMPKQVVFLIFVTMYMFMMKYAYNLSTDHDIPHNTQEISLFKIIAMFTLFSILIISISWALVLVCKQMSLVPVPLYGKPLGEHFIGTLLLALATSIPELATSFQIIRYGNTNMAVENISGSNIFNLLVLVTSSFFTRTDFWNELPINSIYTVFIVFMMSLLICVVGVVKESKKHIYSIYSIIILLWVCSLWIVF